MMCAFELRHSKFFFRKALGLHSRKGTDSVHASTLVEGARPSGEVPLAAPLFTLCDRARRSSRSASSAKPSKSSYCHDKLCEFESRSHRCLGDAAEVTMVRQWLCLAPEFSFDKINAEPMAAHPELVQAGRDGMVQWV